MTDKQASPNPAIQNLLPHGCGPSLALIKTLNESIRSARASFPPLSSNGVNPHFDSDYATLDDVLATVLPSLEANGLDIWSDVQLVNEKPMVITTVMHSDGGYRTSCFPVADLAPQKIGGTMTYAQRYNICALFSLQVAPDDDGNKAQGLPKRPAAKAAANGRQNGVPKSKPAAASNSDWL